MFIWRNFSEPQEYLPTLSLMESKAEKIRTNNDLEEVWLLEHPSLYTKGTSGEKSELLEPERFPVYEIGRGGRYTYHGPGQRIGYLLLDLRLRRLGVKEFIKEVEAWLIRALKEIGVTASVKEDKIGVWVDDTKIAAIGFRIIHGVSTHGFALNVNPELGNFKGIIPCGIQDFGVTSLKELGFNLSLSEVDEILKETCPF